MCFKNKRRVIFLVFILMFVFSHNLYAEEDIYYHHPSVSLDTITFIAMLIFSDSNMIFQSMWFNLEINWATANQRELGFGIALRRDRVALTANYRSFFNKERQSGFFWGYYGLVEWRKMYWFYNENSDMVLSTTFPDAGHENAYHSIGATAGVNIGFRIRGNNFGITPFLGAGVPLFYCFGNVPSQNFWKFYLDNMLIRSVNIGLRVNFFL